MAKMATNPLKASARIFFFLMWLGSLLIMAAYAATLTGFLVKPFHELPFYDIKTLYENGRVEGYR